MVSTKKLQKIGDLNTDCLERNAWDSIKAAHSVENITDPLFIRSLESFEGRTFKTEILFFKESPKELIGISDDHYSDLVILFANW